MTIDYDNDAEDFILECDDCGQEASRVGDWQDCWGYFRSQGWRAHKTSLGEWEHACPECVAAFRSRPKEE